VTRTAASRALGKIALLLSFASASFSSIADGQAIVRVDKNVSLRLGIGLQGWADWAQDPTSLGYAQNLYLRRVSLYLSGQVAPGVTFFLRTDSPNLGRQDSASSFIVEDGYVEWAVANSFIVDGGVILIPFCRNCLEASVRLLTMDFGSFSFLANSLTQSSVARDAGFQVKGYLAGDRLEYRIGAFAGRRQSGSRNSLRWAGRLQYNLFETEKGQFYPGVYFGTKKVLALGAGLDSQGDYRAWAADLFLDLPARGGDGVTAQIDWLRWDGGRTFPTLLRQDDLFFEGGYYIRSIRVLPWVRFERQTFSGDSGGSGQKRVQLGATWYGQGHSFNIRAGYGRVMPSARGVDSTNQITLQVQVFYY
jgi:hypothetical protein